LLYESVDETTRMHAERSLAELVASPDCFERCLLMLQSTFLLNYLGEKYLVLPSFVITSLCHLFARIIKTGWNDFLDDSQSFPFRIHITELQDIVDVKYIKYILVFSYNLFFQLHLVNDLVQLILNCLSYDFIGTLPDESSEDNYTVQLPIVWRECFLNYDVLAIFFSLYEQLPVDQCPAVLQVLVQLASLRRTLFSGEERQIFLDNFVHGIVAVIKMSEKLEHQQCFHELCRIVARLKGNYQLSELMKTTDYNELVELLGNFTEYCLRTIGGDGSSWNSLYYLLSFWQRMVSSMTYVKNNEHNIDLYIPRIFVAFLESRFEWIDDDPFADQGALQQIMEHISVIVRCEYEKNAEKIIDHFDVKSAIYERANGSEINQTIDNLYWLISIIGACIRGRSAFNAVEEYDLIDGKLIALKLMQLTDQKLSNGLARSIKIESALLYVLEQFRKIYINDHIQRISKVYEVLEPELGIQDESAMLVIFVRKIITNLKYWPNDEKLLKDSLALLNELSLGYTAMRRLTKLTEIRLLLTNHTSEHFPFLSSDVDLKIMRSRTIFYSSLSRLLYLECNDDESMFFSFMEPLTLYIHFQRAIIGLCRDIRGIGMACSSKIVFSLFINWMYPNVFSILLQSCEVWSHCCEVINPILKLLLELSQNRQQRLQFEMSSCFTVLLFREISKILCTYGERISMPVPSEENAYKERYKNIATCFAIIRMGLCGSYLPFGVFHLYGDMCLDNALNIYIKLFISIPEEDFFAYNKVSQFFFAMIDSVAADYMAYLSNLQPEIICTILDRLRRGAMSSDAVVHTSSCSTLDSIVTHIYRKLSRPTENRGQCGKPVEGNGCVQATKMQPNILKETLSQLLNMYLFVEVKCQWSVSRPLLGLILLNKEYFQNWKEEFLRAQRHDKRAVFEEALFALNEGIDWTLQARNKDAFTQNLCVFRRTVSFCFDKLI
uniref:Exportin-7 n=1 Tax=Dracunculus medinensis TaxID=318479 RepID=A0A158Q4K4_DRAME